MIEFHKLLAGLGSENPKRPIGDWLIDSAAVAKLERLRIGHAAAAFHLEANITAELILVIVEVDRVARGYDLAVGYPLDNLAVAVGVCGNGYRVLLSFTLMSVTSGTFPSPSNSPMPSVVL